MGLFDEQIARKPNHYPWTQDFIDRIWAGFWTSNEFNFKGDYGQFKTALTDHEREIIVRCLSAIGQVEIAVKTFWAKLGDNLPHPAMFDLGYAMANTEVIHNQAYEKLLTVLQLGDVFEENLKNPIVKGRVDYLRKYLKKVYDGDSRKQYIYAIILFTLFVENVSLFSQFYIILWFNRYKNVLKDTAQQVQYTRTEECYVAGTEVLTPGGWRLISAMEVGDPVYQFNDGVIEEVRVTNTVKRLYNGDVYRFHRKSNTCVVTPDHEMIVKYLAPEDLRRVKAKDVKFHKKMAMPKTGVLRGAGADSLSAMERVYLAIQADGSRGYWKNTAGEKLDRGTDGGFNYYIAVRKQRKINRLRQILPAAGVRFTESPADNQGHVTFRIRIEEDLDLKTLDWVSPAGKSAAWCRDFVDELTQWDGWVTESGARGYCSTVKSCVDKVQLIGILAGYATNIIGRTDDRSNAFSDSWRVSFNESAVYPISHSVTKVVESYDGEVSCVTVPSGAIITRLGDDTFISGNCLHAEVGIKLINTLRVEYPELFDDELIERVRQECIVAFESEAKIVDWMLGDYREGSLHAPLLKTFIKKRINDSIVSIGFEKPFKLSSEEDEYAKQTIWMDEELFGNNHTDFFMKKPVEYAKKNRAYNEEDLF